MIEAVKKLRGFQVRLPSPDREEYSKHDLYVHYYKPISIQVSRYVKDNRDVPDITHNVFVRIYRNWHKFNTKTAGGWMALLTQNELSDHFKRERNRPSKTAENEYYSDVGEILHDNGFSDPASLLVSQQAIDRLLASINLLKKEKDREILFDKEYLGYTSKEIMEKHNIKSEGGVNEKVFRLRRAVKQKCGPADFLPGVRGAGESGCLSESELCTYDESHGLLNN
ncbi:MAG: RNA polymerase sigma factor [Bacteroidales bacterium]